MDHCAPVGDPAAFSTLVARHRSELYVHCLRILRSPEQAEDALQEALLRAWRSRSGYAGRSTVRAWLYRIATNACLDEIRRGRGRPSSATGGAPRPAGRRGDAARRRDRVRRARPGRPRRGRGDPRAGLPGRHRAAAAAAASGADPVRGPALPGRRGRGPARHQHRRGEQRPAAGQGHPGRRRSAAFAAGGWRAARPGSAERALLDRYVDAVRRHDVAAVVALAQTDGAGSAAPLAAA